MGIRSANRKILSFPAKKATCILKKLDPVRSIKSISQRLLHYIDELTKYPSQAKHYKPQNADAANLKPGEDFVEHPARVFARGFFIKEIQARTGKSPHLLEPGRMLRIVDEIWRERIAVDSERTPKSRSASLMHNGVISISPEFGRLITESGRDVDKFLLQLTHNAVRDWQKHTLAAYNKAKKGRKLAEKDVKFAYIVGVHHDRQHIHAHFCVYPYTEQGRYIPWSDNHRKNDMIYTELTNNARKDAFACFRDEIYAPAYLVSIGQDLRWQTHLLAAKARSDAANPSVKRISGAPERLDRIGRMGDEEYREALAEAYDWAKERWRKLAERKITPEEISVGRKSLGEMSLQARAAAMRIAKNRENIRMLALRKKALAESLKRRGKARRGFINLSSLESGCDFWMLLLGCAFGGKGADPRLFRIFKSLAGKSPKYSLYMSIMELCRDMYEKSPKEERRLLREIVHFSCKVRPDSAAEKLFRKKIGEEIASADSAIGNCQEEISAEMENIREMHCRASEIVLDLYLKGCIVKNRKPVIFRPEIEAEMKRRRAKTPGKTESIFACVRRLKAAKADASYTPDMAFDGARRRLTLEEAKKISPENEAVR